METEILTIFNPNHQRIGTATREEVHRLGYWHETFHCWFTAKEKGIDMLYLQLRSPLKKDYPDLLDITAAGHLLATETVGDGVREVQEETGIEVTLEDLTPLGIIPTCMTKTDMIDNELAHVFVYRTKHPLRDFSVQAEEVAGMCKVVFQDFADLWHGNRQTIRSHGFLLDDEGQQQAVERNVSRADFVPHPQSYYHTVIQEMERIIS